MNLLNRIDEALLQEREGRTHQRRGYYPSEVNKCTRYLVYNMLNTEPSNPFNSGTLWKFKLGDSTHELCHALLVKAGLDVIPEVAGLKDIGLKLPLSYRVDNLFIDDDGEIAGAEVKSSFGTFIRQIKHNGYPRQADIEQVIVYMDATGLKRFYLIYVGRDDAYRMQFVVDYRNGVLCCDGKPVHATAETLYKKFKVVEELVATATIPEREYRLVIKEGEPRQKVQKAKVDYKSDWQCFGCLYRDHCWTEELSLYQKGDNIDVLFKVGGSSNVEEEG